MKIGAEGHPAEGEMPLPVQGEHRRLGCSLPIRLKQQNKTRHAYAGEHHAQP